MFDVYQAYIEQDAAIQKLQNLRNIDVQTVCLITPFINFKCLISCILFNIGPNGLVPSPARFETRQFK